MKGRKMIKSKFTKTDIQGGKYHLLDLKESIDNLVNEFHRQIPVGNDSDLQNLWNTVSRCCKKFIKDNEEDNEQNSYWKNFNNINAERNKDKSENN